MNPPGRPASLLALLSRVRAPALAFAIAALLAPTLLATTHISATFNSGNPWPIGSYGHITPQVDHVTTLGTVDTYNGSRSGALRLRTDSSGAAGYWSSALQSGRFALSPANTQTNLGKLTLSFDLNTTEVAPVLVRIRSFTAAGVDTGSRYTIVTPPVANSFYRFSVDLSQMVAGSPDFKPLDPHVRLDFEINSGGASGWPKKSTHVVLIDNVSYTSPSYYVSLTGSDSASGLTEAAPFRTVQKAINVATAGDVICIRAGQYNNTSTYLAQFFLKNGTPAAWIVVRPFPGENVTLYGNGWNVIKADASCSYIEIRDLFIRGAKDTVTLAAAIADSNTGSGTALYNGSGISVEGRSITVVDPGTGAISTRASTATEGGHHFRFIRNWVYDHCGGGIGTAQCDYVTIEDNDVYRNSYYTRHATSGISLHRSWDFETATAGGHKSFIVANTSWGNQCKVNWTGTNPPKNHISDGNGIIIDTNWDDAGGPYYRGRTLIQNNLSYGNGGAGLNIHESTRVDAVNNTTYFNVQSQYLKDTGWGEVMVGRYSNDVRFRNNIVFGRLSVPLTIRGGSGASLATQISYDYTLFGSQSGGAIAPGDASHTNNLSATNADAVFVTPGLDGAANFQLEAASPALNNGLLNHATVPRLDREGTVRPRGTTIDRGAREL